MNLLSILKKRPRSLGITTAASYLREFQDCTEGKCPSGLVDGLTPAQWRRMMKEAAKKLVYHHDDMLVLGPATKEVGSDLVLPPHTIATSRTVITTTRKDRDGDVLETKGADLDPRSAYLFNHLPSELIGKLLQIGKHTPKMLDGVFSVMDTPFGNDMAIMLEHGALRTSHGFLPKDGEYEPLDPSDPYSGWHILEFKILEVSAVSIPSNEDAIPTAFSRNKFAHPLIKQWASYKFKGRKKFVQAGIDLKGTVPPGTTITIGGDGNAPPEPSHAKGHCGCGGSCTSCRSKSLEHDVSQIPESKPVVPHAESDANGEGKSAPTTTKGLYVPIENGWSDIQQDLNDSLLAYLIGTGHASATDWAYVVDVLLEGPAIACLIVDGNRPYDGWGCMSFGYDDDRCRYFTIEWEMEGDEPKWTGTPIRQEITAQLKPVAERAFAAFKKAVESGTIKMGVNAKEGRAFSAANMKRIKSAAGMFGTVADDDDAHNDVRGMANKGMEALNGLFAAGGDDGSDPTAYTDDGKSAKAGAAVSKKNAAIIEEAIGHGNGIAGHDKAGDDHKALAKGAVKKLKAVLQQDADGSMSLNGGNPAGSEDDGKSILAAGVQWLRDAVAHHATTGDAEPLKSVAEMLNDTTSSIERREKFRSEEQMLEELCTTLN